MPSKKLQNYYNLKIRTNKSKIKNKLTFINPPFSKALPLFSNFNYNVRTIKWSLNHKTTNSIFHYLLLFISALYKLLLNYIILIILGSHIQFTTELQLIEPPLILNLLHLYHFFIILCNHFQVKNLLSLG